MLGAPPRCIVERKRRRGTRKRAKRMEPETSNGVPGSFWVSLTVKKDATPTTKVRGARIRNTDLQPRDETK